ncbi:hypothetical protein ES703_95994 [subsurface metagenome]
MLTEDLNFFYRLNKELERLQVKFEVLNIGNKIPNIPNSIILSTLKEMNNFENVDKIKGKILPYAKEDNFEQYIVKVLAGKKIGKKNYSELIFSIDPGTKHLGLVIFLDDYYLNSHTIYDYDKLINIIQTYFFALQEGNPNPLKLIFKFGRGIMPITQKLIEEMTKLNFIIIDSITNLYNLELNKDNKKKNYNRNYQLNQILANLTYLNESYGIEILIVNEISRKTRENQIIEVQSGGKVMEFWVKYNLKINKTNKLNERKFIFNNILEKQSIEFNSNLREKGFE